MSSIGQVLTDDLALQVSNVQVPESLVQNEWRERVGSGETVGFGNNLHESVTVTLLSCSLRD